LSGLAQAPGRTVRLGVFRGQHVHIDPFSTKLIIVYVFAATVLFVHFRGRVRHRFVKQLTDHSTFVAPYNTLMYAFSAVPSKPYIDMAAFPELATLRDNWEIIRDEALALADDGHIRAAAKANDIGFNSFFKYGWKRFYLKWYEDPLPSARALCPKTVELLASIPTVHGAMFAMLPAGGKLGVHRDPYAGSLRYHLGLRTPNSPDCRIIVDGESYYWKDGEGVVFDETFIHWAENKTTQNRFILFCDVERPLRNRVITALNRWVSHNVIKASTTGNVEGERVGALNRLFHYFNQLDQQRKRLKNWNRKVYYAVRWGLLALLVVVIVI
jgi:beta-hydroxylase